MAMFVHLASENDIASIKRVGIKPCRSKDEYPGGVFAMPVTPEFYISHQWLRELKRRGHSTISGVYFRIPDDELVLVGHYNQHHIEVTADKAIDIIMHAENAEGYQVYIPRRIDKNEIHRVKPLPQVVGWRYQPDSHKKWYCGCLVCVPIGSIKGKRKRDDWELSQS